MADALKKELTPGPSLGKRGERKREESRDLSPREPPSLAKRRGLPAWLADRGDEFKGIQQPWGTKE